ncbi:protein kinase domain-containing protein [Archangium sp.]|uniref:serine/threonine-protein kinase n=1 Tax=Archangium sp. TaxID=1872627 RepID=UPI00286B1673|nr:protein kinase [Archangium sp.]
MSESVEGRPSETEAGWTRRRGPRRKAEREPVDTRPPALGTRVGGLRLEARLGEGGQGTVYRARRGGRLYAVKVLSLELTERAWRELEVRLRLRRAGAVKLLGCGLWPDQKPRFLFIVMPYVRGRPLDTWAGTNNPTAREVARLARELARQLARVHRAGVVHRDVKAANVLVRRADGTPVLVDFGLGTYPGAPAITHPLALPGTPLYRSPELLRFRREYGGSERYQARASDDLWALGVLLYWLLTGSHPFDVEEAGADEGTLANVILRGEPEPPHVRNPRVPRALSELCLRMLEKSPEARFPEAEAVGAELEAVLAEADGTWDVALCETWGPDEATTSARERLGLADWRDKEERLRRHARLHPRRGRARPLAEASTLGPSRDEPAPEVTEARPASPPETQEAPPTSPPETQEAPPSAPAPRAGSRLGRAVAWGCIVLTLGLVAWWAVSVWPSTSGPGAPRPTPEAGSTPTMPEVKKLGEVARTDEPPEGDAGAAPSRAPTPAPVARATPREDSTPMKPSKQAPSTPKTQQKPWSTATRSCLWVWTAGQLACVATEAQVRPTPPPPPPPADCPAGAVERMKELGIPLEGGRRLSPPVEFPGVEYREYTTVRPGAGATLLNPGPWGKLPAHTVFSGKLFIGETRVYGYFTQAHTPEGRTYSVCMRLNTMVDKENGIPREPGTGQHSAKVRNWYLGLEAVERLAYE